MYTNDKVDLWEIYAVKYSELYEIVFKWLFKKNLYAFKNKLTIKKY